MEKAPQEDINLFYDNDALNAGYIYSEELFAKEFTGFMNELSAVPVREPDPDRVKNQAVLYFVRKGYMNTKQSIHHKDLNPDSPYESRRLP